MATEQGINLTRAAYIGRQTIKFGSITLVTLIIGRFLLSSGIHFWIATHPKAPPPPTAGFGALPPIRFPTQAQTDKPSAYQLQIPESRLPSFGDRAKVFLMIRSSIGLFTDQKAKQIAASYGFVFQPRVLSETSYRWTKTQPLQSTLEMNVQNFTFDLKTDYLSHAELLSSKNVPSADGAEQVIKSFVNSGQSLPSDLATASAEVKFLKYSGGDLTEAIAVSDADFVQADLRRTPVDGNKPFFTSKGDLGAVHAILTSALSGRDQVVEMTYHYQQIDYNERQTYPLRSVSSAWQLIQAGEGYIANKGSADTAVIRNVRLGYYDDVEEQDYMQPIYVFEGDDGFLGYVPAVDPRFYQQPTPAPVESPDQSAGTPQ